MDVKAIYPSLREQHSLQLMENKVLRRVFKPSLQLPSIFA